MCEASNKLILNHLDAELACKSIFTVKLMWGLEAKNLLARLYVRDFAMYLVALIFPSVDIYKYIYIYI